MSIQSPSEDVHTSPTPSGGRIRRLLPTRQKTAVTATARRLAGRMMGPLAATGGLTQLLIDRYCRGRGVEIGPGVAPYARHSLMVDRHAEHRGKTIELDAAADAAALPLRSRSLAFVLSAHCLEHHFDPLTTLEEWVRVIRPGGHLFLILPHVERTFDRGRRVATLAHHRLERGLALDSDNPPHWEEYARWSLRDAPDDQAAWNADGSWNRRWFVEQSHIHYHAWTQHEMTEIVASVGCKICVVLERLPERADSFAVIARVDGDARLSADDRETPD